MEKVFAVRDVKSDAFGIPMACPTRGVAIRSFADAIADGRTEYAKHSEDYMLYEIGEYEPNTGELRGHKVPALVVTALAIKEQLAAARRPVLPAEVQVPEHPGELVG